MEHTYEELSKMTVAQMREIARELKHDSLRGYSTMHKEHLLPALCHALGIEAHAHVEVVGVDKTKVKAQIRKLKVERDKVLEGHDKKALKKVRREIRSLKRKLRKATVHTG